MRRISRLLRNKIAAILGSIQTPTLHAAFNILGPGTTTPYSSPFVPIGFSGTHESSDWQVCREPNFTPVQIIYSSEAKASEVQMIDPNVISGFYNTLGGQYLYVRTRHRSQGMVSAWSPTLEWFVPVAWF